MVISDRIYSENPILKPHLTQNGITQTKQTILAIFTNSCFFHLQKFIRLNLDSVINITNFGRQKYHFPIKGEI